MSMLESMIDPELLKRWLAQAMQEPDKQAPMNAGMLSAGLGILAANNGRQSPWAAIGQGGLMGVQAYNDSRKEQKRDPMAMLGLANAAMQFQNNSEEAKQKQLKRGAYAEMASESQPGFVGPPQVSMPTGQGGTYDALLAQAKFMRGKGLGDEANALLEKAEKYRPKLKDVKTLSDKETGKPVVVEYYDDGTSKVTPYAPDEGDLHWLDDNSGIRGVSRRTGEQRTGVVPKQVSPDTKLRVDTDREQFTIKTDQADRHFNDTSKRGWAGITQADRHHADNNARGYAGLNQAERLAHLNLDRPEIRESDSGYVAVRPMSGQASPITMGGEPVTKSKEMPSQYVAARVQNEQTLNKVGMTLDLLSGKKVGDLQGDPKASAPVLGRLPGGQEWLNIMDTKGVPTRAAIQDLGSQIILNRSGAAVTLAEFERTKSFIPRIEDRGETLRAKLQYLQKIVQEENAALEAQAKAQGYKTPKQKRDDPFGARQDADPWGVK